VGLLPPRPRALARLPLGGGRAGRDFGQPPAALLRAGAVERARPHPQGAPLRVDRDPGEPRRGRQGIPLLPRFHADALVHEVPLQVPAGGLPLRASRDGERQAHQERARVRAARHGGLRRGPLLRRHYRVRQGRRRRHPRPHHRRQPRARGGRARRPADPLVPQHLGLGRGRGQAPPEHVRERCGRGGGRGGASDPRTLPADRRGRARTALRRQRDQPSAHLRDRGAHALSEGRDQRLCCRGARRRGESGVRGNQVRRALPPDAPARRVRHAQAQAERRWRGLRARPIWPRLRTRHGRAPRRGRRLLQSGCAAHPVRRRARRDAPGLERHALEQAVLPLRRQALARG
jgi:hypothetical protein